MTIDMPAILHGVASAIEEGTGCKMSAILVLIDNYTSDVHIGILGRRKT